ncbi:MAG: hypothetical protein HYV90_05465 [Candidatus Woesebacteria bacterium]|nr:MAG: hypothetical protein HYV90_05465 [Candidatus Woesebacteria bacterium]
MTVENTGVDEQLDNDLGTIGDGHEGRGDEPEGESIQREDNVLETL